MYNVTFELEVRRDPKGAMYKLVMKVPLLSGTYELTKEYPNHDEAMKAFAGWVRKQTVEAEGETPPEPEA